MEHYEYGIYWGEFGGDVAVCFDCGTPEEPGDNWGVIEIDSQCQSVCDDCDPEVKENKSE